MRLRQLARKLEVKPSEIQSFLKKEHSIEVDEGPNVKLIEEHVELVMAAFDLPTPPVTEEKPEQESEVVEEEEIAIAEEDETPAEAEEEVVEEPIVEEEVEVEEEALIDFEEPYVEAELPSVDAIEADDQNDLSQDRSEDEEENEVITAPIVELPGVKVIGKIELPEEVEREMPMVEIDGVMRAARPKRRDDKKKRKPGEIRKPRSVKGARKERDDSRYRVKDQHNENFLSEEDRKKLEEQRIKEKAEKEKLEKERRKKHYKAKHAPKTAPPKKVKKKVEEKKTKKAAAAKEKEEAPKTTLGKVWKWFNT